MQSRCFQLLKRGCLTCQLCLGVRRQHEHLRDGLCRLCLGPQDWDFLNQSLLQLRGIQLGIMFGLVQCRQFSNVSAATVSLPAAVQRHARHALMWQAPRSWRAGQPVGQH